MTESDSYQFLGNNVNGSVASHLKEDSVSQLSCDGVSSEGTPDLLDSTSSLRPPYNSSTFDLDDNSQQLPDITSVRNTVCHQSPPVRPVFDLIKSQPEQPLVSNCTLESSCYKPFDKQVRCSSPIHKIQCL